MAPGHHGQKSQKCPLNHRSQNIKIYFNDILLFADAECEWDRWGKWSDCTCNAKGKKGLFRSKHSLLRIHKAKAELLF